MDLRKQYAKLYYTGAKATSPRLVEAPPLHYVMIDGSGDPNTCPVFQKAMGTLYPVAYGVKFAAKAAGMDFGVMPLEGLWWSDPPEAFATAQKSSWFWTVMILQDALDLFSTASYIIRRIEHSTIANG